MRAATWAQGLGRALAICLVVLLVLPIVALLGSASPEDVAAGAAHPMFAPALWLSVRSTAISLAVIVLMGTPLAWWLARSTSRRARAVALLVDLPLIVPPAAMGVALLQTYGRGGVVGPTLVDVGVDLPFTFGAVVVAQVVVSAPFYVQAAANAFREVDEDHLIVARTLGASGPAAFFRVALPVALPGLVAGASLAWARALGELGATLLFAGSLSGETQTMPVAILTALESDVRVAIVFALVLVAVGVLLLVGLRGLPSAWRRVAGGGTTAAARHASEVSR